MKISASAITSLLVLLPATYECFTFTSVTPLSCTSVSNGKSNKLSFSSLLQLKHGSSSSSGVGLLRMSDADVDVDVVESLDVVEEVSATVEGEEETASSTDEEKKEEDVKLYVGNLSFSSTPSDINELFAPFGTITETQVPKDRKSGMPRGFAFVSMATQEMADAAIAALNESEFDGRDLKVSISLPVGDAPPNRRKGNDFVQRSKLYVGNISFEATAEEVADLFAEYGKVHDSYLPTDRETGLPRGFAFVTMDEESAKAAIEALDGTIFLGREVIVNESVPKGQKPPNSRREFSEGGGNTRRLYVGNLSFDADEETLLDLFTEFGDVKEVFVPTWPDTGRTKGFAFVTIASDAASVAIEETDGLEFLGRSIVVNEAQKRSSNR